MDDLDGRTDDAAAAAARELTDAAERMRRRIRSASDPSAPFPMDFVLLELARLLQELAGSLARGRPLEEHVVWTAQDIARHIRHRDRSPGNRHR